VVFGRKEKLIIYEKFNLRWSWIEEGRSVLAADLILVQ
jgi:hypothetical protein